jgi:hypothetical protein
MLAKNAKFDWYQTTVMVQNPQESGLVDHLLKAWEFTDWAPAKNLNGYLYGGAIVRGDRVLCHLCWGGEGNQGLGVNCKTTSDESPVLAKALSTFPAMHLPTRIDSAVDWRESGLFDSLSNHLIEYAKANRIKIDQQGDWARGESRTLYIGSKCSPVRLVLYEKGYEQGGDAPRDWVRLEARIKPNKVHRHRISTWTASEVFCAGWIPEALEALGWDDLDNRSSVGTVWRKDDTQRARAALLRQYGAIMAAWAEEVGGWSEFGSEVGQTIEKSSTPLPA